MGVPTLTAAIGPNIDGGLLYWDGTRLQVGSYTKERGLRSSTDASINLANVIFAKSGGVIGFINAGTAWSNSHVKFNPITPGGTLAWSSIRYFNGTVYDEGYISTSAYHNATNVQAGRGDICMLAGRTPTEARTDIDNKTWRLPTNVDNQRIVGDNLESFSFDDTVSPGVITFSSTYSLPALGYRGADTGAPSGYGTAGVYWTSTSGNLGVSYNLLFEASVVTPFDTSTINNGQAIRCVRQ